MLLRVATVAATGVLLGACSSDTSKGAGSIAGSVPADCGDAGCGSIGYVPDASPDAEDASLACGTGVCGSIVMLTDAAADGAPDGSDQ